MTTKKLEGNVGKWKGRVLTSVVLFLTTYLITDQYLTSRLNKEVPAPTQSEIVLAKQKRELALERERLTRIVGSAFDFNGDGMLSAPEIFFSEEYVRGKCKDGKSYEEVLKKYSSQYLQRAEMTLPDNRRKEIKEEGQ